MNQCLSEIHENNKNSKNKHFKVALLTDWPNRVI